LRGIRLRCFAYRNRAGEFEAECIDLNLFIKAKSMNKAVNSLNDAIQGYLEVALGGDVTGLVPRPSPLPRRLFYHWVSLRLRLKHTQATSSKKLFDFKECAAPA
jgi:hypothetical protein